MSDLIKTRKGIFIPDITVEMFRNASLEAVEELLVSGEMQDIILPSAEPERLTDDDFETIRIHLNAQKEKLCNQRRWEEAEEYQRIIDRFMAFASAQPDSQPTCNNLATDTISRQAAIDAVNKIAPVNTEYDCTLLDILDVRYVLTELPSAEPEIIRCKDCKYWILDGCKEEDANKWEYTLGFASSYIENGLRLMGQVDSREEWLVKMDTDHNWKGNENIAQSDLWDICQYVLYVLGKESKVE